MRAMILSKVGSFSENPKSLSLVDWPQPKSGVNDLLIQRGAIWTRDTEDSHQSFCTRLDVREFLPLASEIPIRQEIEEYDLKDANRALGDLKSRYIRGAKVLRIG